MPQPKSNEPRLPAVAYARVSTESQAEDEIPISAQLDEIRRYAGANGYEIVEEFVDAGITGRIEERPEFIRLRKLITSGKAAFHAVIVWRSNRFARSLRIAQGFRYQLASKGLDLLSVTEPNIGGPVGKLMSGMMDLFNEYVSEQIGEDVCRGMKASAAEGYAQGGQPPFGYRKVPMMTDGGAIKKRLAPDPLEAPILREIYEMYASGKGLYVICRTFRDRGIKGRTGRPFDQATVYNILFWNRPYYLGNLVFNRSKTMLRKRVYERPESEWIVAEGVHEPLITQELSDAVDRARKAAPSMKAQIENGESPLLGGLVRCGICGALFRSLRARSGKPERGVKHRYYFCPKRKNSTVKNRTDLCSNIYLRAEIIEPHVVKEIRALFTGKRAVKRMLKEVEERRRDEDKARGIRIEDLRKEESEVQRRKGNLLDAVESGTLPLCDVAARLEKLRGQLASVQARIREYSAPTPVPSALDPETVSQVILIALDDPSRMRGLIAAVVKEILVFPDRFEIHYRIPAGPSLKLLESGASCDENEEGRIRRNLPTAPGGQVLDEFSFIKSTPYSPRKWKKWKTE